MTEANNAATETVKKTAAERRAEKIQKLYDRIVADTAEYNKLTAEVAAEAAVASVGEGAVLDISVGRGENATVKTGVVLGVGEDEAGNKKIKVQVGAGFSAEIFVVNPGQVVAVHPAVEADQPVEQAAE